MGFRMLRLFALTAVLGMVTPALAQEGESDLPDKYSVRTEQKLMLTGSIKNTLPKKHFDWFVSDIGFNRFEVLTQSDPNAQEVKDWCNKVIVDTQVRRDDVDGETGDAVVTAEAKADRCSQILKHDLTIKHKCVKTKKKKKRYWSCSVWADATIYKYKYKSSTEGFSFVPDKKFGKKGKIKKDAMWINDSEIKKNSVHAKDSALFGATFGAALWMKRALRNIKEFQIHAPIVSAKKGYAMTCLGKDTVEQDMPFHVIIKTSKGEVKKGFVKARDIFDGCTMTPSMEEKQTADTDKRAKKKKKARKLYTIKPMRSEIILGGSGVKQGMTAWEMPSIGLNVGLTAGLSNYLGGMGPSVGLGIEFNTAPYLYRFLKVRISELHIFINTRMTVGDTANIAEATGISPEWFQSGNVGQAEVGLLKRVYVAGPVFAEVGLGASYSKYLLGSANSSYEVAIQTPGFTAQGALGMQLSARTILKAEVGLRSGTPVVTVNGDTVGTATDVPNESGIKGLLMFLYNI